jgi:hypothetical protein
MGSDQQFEQTLIPAPTSGIPSEAANPRRSKWRGDSKRNHRRLEMNDVSGINN